MNGHLTWYAARASGLVAWGLVLASIVWGLLLATRVLGRRPTPAWLLSLHRYLGALAVAFVGVHVGAILARQLHEHRRRQRARAVHRLVGSPRSRGASSACTCCSRSRSRR